MNPKQSPQADGGMQTQSGTKTNRGSRAGFTLVELLVSVAIIALLIAAVFPLFSRLQTSARETGTRNLIRNLESAIEVYKSDTNNWPGILPNRFFELDDQDPILNTPVASGVINPTGNPKTRVTMSENLVLSLLGGLVDNDPAPANVVPRFDPSLVGQGATSLNALKPGKGRLYFESAADKLSSGKFQDSAGTAFDTVIPEFVDTFQSPLPIIYIRMGYTGSRRVMNAVAPTVEDDNTDNKVVVEGATNNLAPFSIRQYQPYVGDGGSGYISTIGEGISLPSSKRHKSPSTINEYTFGSDGTVSNGPHGIRSVNADNDLTEKLDANVMYPYDAYTYFRDPVSGNVRNKDRYILISAGRDRVFGTDDDITNFGRVAD
jgi:prepilin-type N-terminal cleavage/methylation domain-containing protein